MDSLLTSNERAKDLDRFALQYSYGEAEKFLWIMRGIRRDGVFYGEVHLENPLKNTDAKFSKLLGVCSWVQNKPLTTSECAAVYENFEAIRQLPTAQRLDKAKSISTKQGCIYRREESDYLYLHYPESSATPEADRYFLNITAVLHPYLSTFEQQCRDLMPEAQQRHLIEMSENPEKPSIFRRLLGWKFLL